MDAGTLFIDIQANSEGLSDSLNSATEKMNKVGKSLSKAGASMTKKVTAPILGIGAGILKVGADFEQSMAKLQAVSGASGKDLEDLKKKAEELGKSTRFSASEAAEGLNFMAMAGWETQDMMKGIGPVLNLATAAGEDLATVSDIVTDSMTAFGLEAKDTTRFTDVLAATSSAANTNVSMLGESFKYVAPIAGAMGYSIDDTAVALGLMANAGIKSSQAGTSLRGSLTRMAKPTGEAAKLMEDLGLNVADSEGNMKPLNEVMGDLRTSFAGMTEEQKSQAASTIFGQEAMSGMLAIINASEGDYNKLAKEIQGADGAAEDMAETMNDTLAGRIAEMKSSLEGLAIELFDNLAPSFERIVESITKVSRWFGGLSEETQDFIIKTALIVAAIGPIIMSVGKFILMIANLAKVFSAVSTAITAAGGIMAVLTGPVAIAIGAVVALIAIGVALYKNWDVIKEKAGAFFGKMKEVFGKVKDFIVGAFLKIGETMLKATPVGMVIANWDKIKKGASILANKVTEAFSWLKEQGIKNMQNMFNFFKNIDLFKSGMALLTRFGEGIMAAFGKVRDKVKTVAGKIRDFFPFSPAKVGPLKDINKMDFGGPVSDSIKKGQNQMTRAAGEALEKVKRKAINEKAKITDAMSLGGRKFSGTSEDLVKGISGGGVGGRVGGSKTISEVLSEAYKKDREMRKKAKDETIKADSVKIEGLNQSSGFNNIKESSSFDYPRSGNIESMDRRSVEMEHSGTIEVRGIDNEEELAAVVRIVMKKLRREVRQYA